MKTREEFITRARAEAQKARDLGAPIVVGAVVAQAALESCFGQSGLAIHANNLFGIKATKAWNGPVIDMDTKEQTPAGVEYSEDDVRWRVYASWSDCFINYGGIIARTKWYQDCVYASNSNDARAFIHGLVNSGEPRWATDVKYEDKVLRIAQDYHLI